MFKNILSITLTLIALAFSVEATEQRLDLDLEATAVTFTLGSTMHTVEGILHLSEGAIVFDLEKGDASGRVVFDATATETGNEKRDRKMHKKVLESTTFPEIIFTPDAVEGTLAENGNSDLVLHGTVSIHGSTHPVTLEAQINRQGATVSADATLVIPFVEWGMHDPSVFVFRTDKEVKISLKIYGTLAG